MYGLHGNKGYKPYAGGGEGVNVPSVLIKAHKATLYYIKLQVYRNNCPNTAKNKIKNILKTVLYN